MAFVVGFNSSEQTDETASEGTTYPQSSVDRRSHLAAR
jgi:hypothetical protein